MKREKKIKLSSIASSSKCRHNLTVQQNLENADDDIFYFFQHKLEIKS